MSLARRERGRTFASLQHPNFRRFCIGQFISQAGTWMQFVAVGILVLRITDSGVAVGLASVAMFGPLLVLGPWAGVLTDRLDVHHFLLAINAAGAVVSVVFAAVVLTGSPPLWSVFALTTATGVVQALENPVRRAFVAQLVDDSLIPNAISLNSTVMIGSEAVGLAIAGVLIGGPGIAACFVINAVSFGPQLLLFGRIERSRLRRETRIARAAGQMRAGFRYTWHTRALMHPLYLLGALGAFGFTAHTVSFPLLALRDLDGDARTYTVLLTAVSIGSLVGTLVSARRNVVETGAAAWSAIAFGVSTALLGLAPNVASAAVLALVSGYVVMTTVAGMNAELQLRTEPQYRGRVMSVVSMVLIGSGAIGGPALGWVAELAGAPASLMVSGAVVSGTALAVLHGRRTVDRHAGRSCEPARDAA